MAKTTRRATTAATTLETPAIFLFLLISLTATSQKSAVMKSRRREREREVSAFLRARIKWMNDLMMFPLLIRSWRGLYSWHETGWTGKTVSKGVWGPGACFGRRKRIAMCRDVSFQLQIDTRPNDLNKSISSKLTQMIFKNKNSTSKKKIFKNNTFQQQFFLEISKI
jgi:hypothetical protein